MIIFGLKIILNCLERNSHGVTTCILLKKKNEKIITEFVMLINIFAKPEFFDSYNNCATVLREIPMYNVKVPVGLIFVNLKSEITPSCFTQRSNLGEFSK